jgi:hypothetical protein
MLNHVDLGLEFVCLSGESRHCLTGFGDRPKVWRQFHDKSSSQRAAGQLAAILAMTSAMLSLQLDTVKLAALDAGVDRGDVFAAGLRSSEQPVLRTIAMLRIGRSALLLSIQAPVVAEPREYGPNCGAGRREVFSRGVKEVPQVFNKLV